MLMVTAIGYKVAGVPGAVISVLAMFLPVGVVAYVAAENWDRLQRWRWRPSVQRGLAPVTVGLLLAGSYTIARAAVTDVASGVIMAVAALLLLSGRVNPALIIVLGGVTGWLIYR
jgi:chromate transporter